MLFISFSLLKQMKKDESFTKFLDIKRGAAMHTLESLMLLPVREGERERELVHTPSSSTTCTVVKGLATLLNTCFPNRFSEYPITNDTLRNCYR